MTEAGFIARNGDGLVAVGWDEYNASLIANWMNGKKGGRPKSGSTIPGQNPDETHGFSMGNQGESQGSTQAKPIREDRIRGDKKPPIPPKGGETEASRKRAAIAFKTFLDQCRSLGEKPIPESDTVFDYADKAGIPMDFLRLHWLEFKDRYGAPDSKRYKDWRTVYRKSVRGNWFKLWYLRGDGACGLTTQGEQALRIHQETA
jgi:hypothetical protein